MILSWQMSLKSSHSFPNMLVLQNGENNVYRNNHKYREWSPTADYLSYN